MAGEQTKVVRLASRFTAAHRGGCGPGNADVDGRRLSTARHGAGRLRRALESAMPRRADLRIHYGDRAFEAAATLPLRSGLGSPRRLARLLAAGVRRPRAMLALLEVLVRGAPSVHVRLTRSVTGHQLSSYFGRRAFGVFRRNHLFQAVLALPEDYSVYLRGRPRRAVRTNVRRAVGAGIRCESITEQAQALKAWDEVIAQRRPWMGEAERRSCDGQWFAAVIMQTGISRFAGFNTSGKCVAFCAVLIDEDVAMIRVAIATDHDARWCLHAHIVSVLCGRRVKYLLAEEGGPLGALGMPPNLQYYQRLLGYEICHLTARLA